MPQFEPRPAGHEPLLKRIEYALKRLQLRLITRLTKSDKWAQPKIRQLSAGASVCLIRLNNIGDALVATPVIHALKQQRQARITIVCSPRNRVVFVGHPDVDEVIVLEKGIAALWRYVCARHHFDAVVNLHDGLSTSASYVVAFTSAPIKVGLDHGLADLYTATVPNGDEVHEHVLRRLLRLGEPLGLSLDSATANVIFPLTDVQQAVAASWVQTHSQPGQSLVGVNLSAGAAARYWPAQRWAEVLRHLAEHDLTPVLLAAPADEALLREVQARGHTHGVTALDYIQKDYRAFAAILPHLQGLITADTAIVHLASAVRLPVFALYVQVRPHLHRWTPYQSPYWSYETPWPDLSQTLPADVISLMAPFLSVCLRKP